MNLKEQAILERIGRLEEAIAKGNQFLESGEHAHWRGFRPMFVPKLDEAGQQLPPHRDWVRNVFLPRREKALRKAERRLEHLHEKARDRQAKPRFQKSGATDEGDSD